MPTSQPSIKRRVAPVTLTVQADNPGARINRSMWGIFFEDINLGADGGLYAELIKNRSFEFPDPMMGWTRISPSLARGEISIRDDSPFGPANPRYARLLSEGTAPFGISNEGFRGIGIRKGESYHFSAHVRGVKGTAVMLVQLYGADGRLLDSASLEGISSDWRRCTATLHAATTDAKARLALLVEGKGTVDVDMVSLFPEKTWKNRPGGLRADMVQLLADLRPGFMRFPGGCIVEGSDLSKRYQWKNTIGPIEERKLLINRWNYEFLHRPTPDYFQSFGLGFFEFFQLCEDIGAEPLPIVNCGMACQFNSGELVPLDQLDSYIQDALDLIEFANGPTSSAWGAKRAAMGHPEPFNMKMMGIGNEQWGQQYIERYAAFAKALKKKHPEIALVSDAGPSPADERFDFLWPKLRELNADIVDEHCYARPVWFLNNAHRYDRYDRSGPKVFMGEYAAQSDKIVSVDNKNNWECALAEAAFMTGLECNADVVRMASYAPLFAHVDGWQWTPNLIWTDNLSAYGTPNYYVQQLFTLNRGDVVLPVKTSERVSALPPSGCIGLSTCETSAEFKEIRVTRGGKTLFSSDSSSESANLKTFGGKWSFSNGSYQQLNPKGTAMACVGDPSWNGYTLTLKARKLQGSEGFIVIVRNDENETRVQWNLGGWRNTCHGIQSFLGVQEQVIQRIPGKIEESRWYDIRVDLKGPKLNCYLDGKQVHSVDVPVPQHCGFYASAVCDEKAGEIILKLVNAAREPREVSVRLAGVKRIKRGSKAVVLTSRNLDGVNSFEKPRAIAPGKTTVNIRSTNFKQNVSPNSFMVLRIPADLAE